jgi:hypothetical protein
MDALELILFSMINVWMTKYIAFVIPLIISVFIKVCAMSEGDVVNWIDAHLPTITCWMSTATLQGGKRIPGFGLHFAWIGGPVILHRRQEVIKNSYRPVYDVYGFSRSISIIIQSAQGVGAVEVAHFEGRDHWRPEMPSQMENPPERPTDDQKTCIEGVINHFFKHGRASCLLLGPPGTGKSKVATIIGATLSRHKGLQPKVLYGVSLKAKGVYTSDLLDRTSSPLIIVVDEIDLSFFRAAENDKTADSKSEGDSIASGSDRLRNFLDIIGQRKGVIFIGTSNKEDLKELYPENTRCGRFDLSFVFRQPVPKTL